MGEEVAGWITFQTKIDDKYFKNGIKENEKEIKRLEKEGQKLEKQKIDIEVKLQLDKEQYEKDLKEAQDYIERNKNVTAHNRPYIKEQAGTIYEGSQAQLEASTKELEEINKKIEDNNTALENTKKEIDDINKKYGEWKEKQPDGEEEKEIVKEHQKISFGLDNIFKKVTRWALAIFSVRSIYSLIRNAVSSVSQSNKQLRTDIEYMRWALGKALEPVIKRIVEWAFKLLQAINYIVYKLTGFKLFGKATADNFKKANKSAKELQKTMAGFDEMNTVSKTANSNSETGTPSQDLNDFDKLSGGFKDKLDKIVAKLEPIYKYIKEHIIPSLKYLWEHFLKPIGEWIFEKPERLLTVIKTILGLQIASKLGLLQPAVSLIGKSVGALGDGLGELIKRGGNKLGSALRKGGDALTKVGTKAGELAGKIGMKAGGSGSLIGALMVLDTVLVTKVVLDIKNKLIPCIKETKEAIKGATNMVKSGEKKTEEYTKAINENKDALKNDSEKLNQNVDYMIEFISQNDKMNAGLEKKLGWQQKITGEYKLNTEQIKINNRENENMLKTLGDLYTQGMLNKDQVDKYRTALENQITKLEQSNEKLSKNSGEYKENKKKIEELKTQLDKTKGDYNVNLKTETDKKKVDEFENSINKVTGNHKVKLSAETKDANKKIRDWINKIGKQMFGYLFPKLNFDSILTRFGLAKGGIVNLPGRGVPVAGERGMEGVIPLTDERQMELLGEAIGRYISVNLTNITKLDSREIARQTNQVQNENSFIRNR